MTCPPDAPEAAPPVPGPADATAATATGAAMERRAVRRAGLYALAFGSGFAVMTLEMAGARLMAPTFGLSAVPWTAVIGVILTALAVGNHLGGRLADGGRVPLAWILAAAGVFAVLPVIGVAVPPAAMDAVGFVPGAVLAAAMLFAPPVLALGTAVPYLVRADTEGLEQVGRSAGDVGAAATAGSIAGTFLTGFVLLPLFPLPVLLGLTAALLFLLALLARAVLEGGGPPADVLLVAALAAGLLGPALRGGGPGLLHSEQSLYAAVEVTERDWGGGRLVREMWQNGGSSSAEYVDTGDPAHRYAIASELLLEPRAESLDRVLVLGGAALTLPVALKRRLPVLTVDVVELDPAVTRLAREYFAFGRGEWPGLEVHHADARRFLAESDATWDLVYVDVFDHLLSVPWTIVTREAVRDMDARLAPGGLVMINVLSPLAGPGVAFLERFLATLEAVFPAVRAYPVVLGDDPGAVRNVLVVAARSEADLPNVDWPRAPVAAHGPVLTDAWAPVEALQARLFLQEIRWQ
ncbi:MAG: fused MFS/spermidine synthase [Gemmatimonadetes bacterium]|nr:fused MFS/spermidine synthase [Gemmatimonadota bacterium]